MTVTPVRRVEGPVVGRGARAAWPLAVLALAATTITAGCAASPPPALPVQVLAQGADAVPEEHPKLTAEQIAQCGLCHRASDAPKQ